MDAEQVKLSHPVKPFALFFALSLLLLSSCGGKTAVITADMAREGVSNYCRSNYDWSPAEDHPDLMYVTLGDETDSTFQVIFRSYTGSFTYFQVNKSGGRTKMTEYVPALNIEQDAGTIELLDWLK
jgi:hypothetical protein